MGHEGVGWVKQRWGGLCRGGSCWVGVVWGWGGYVGVGWGRSCRVGSGGSSRGGVRWVIQRWDGVGHENIKILKILKYWCYRVSNQANQRSAGY